MNLNGKRILVTLDGSSHALDTTRYLSQILPPRGVELVLFCVLNKGPEYLLDTAEDWSLQHGADVSSDWEVKQKNTIEAFMKNASQLLMDRGFPAEAMMVKIQERKKGIARDIIREAQNGYDAVVVGRQGTNPITRLVIGSIASKLIQSLTFVPLWIVGKTSPGNKILVATDGSEGSMRAVEHLGRMVGGAKVELTLFRVVRSSKAKPAWQAEQLSETVAQDDASVQPDEESISHEIFERASRILEKAGIGHDQITTKVISGVATRSGSIVAQAANGGYGTVVMGRRGHSKVGEFYMGRVTNKVIQLAGRLTVWVVN